MKRAVENHPLLWAGVFIGGFAVLRLWVSGLFPLVPDETNYWQWSRHPAWGYYDQAPMIAWAIRLGTLAFGHTETAVRLPSVLAMTLAAAYLVRLAHRFAGSAAAWHTALLTQGILLFNVGSLLATPDALQAAGWAGASYHTARALEKESKRQWVAAGFWFGFGLLSKYTMVFFPVSVFIFMLLHPAFRKRLTGAGPWAAVTVGLVLFSPVIGWNAAHQWSSVRHVAHIGGADSPLTLHPGLLLEFLGAQVGLVTPVVFLLILLAWFRASRGTGGEWWIFRYLFFTSVIMVAGFALLSLHTRVYPNWPGAGYLTGAVLCALYFGGREARPPRSRCTAFGRRLWPYALGSAYLISAIVILHTVNPLVSLPPQWERIHSEVCGWPDLGVNAHAIKETMPHPEETFFFGLHYQIASELAFYTPGRPRTVSINRWGRPNVYDFWWTDADLKGKDGIGVTYDPTTHTRRLSAVFERVDEPEKLEISVCGDASSGFETPVKVFYLYRCYGFKGGLRWVPGPVSDVRKTD